MSRDLFSLRSKTFGSSLFSSRKGAMWIFGPAIACVTAAVYFVASKRRRDQKVEQIDARWMTAGHPESAPLQTLESPTIGASSLELAPERTEPPLTIPPLSPPIIEVIEPGETDIRPALQTLESATIGASSEAVTQQREEPPLTIPPLSQPTIEPFTSVHDKTQLAPIAEPLAAPITG